MWIGRRAPAVASSRILLKEMRTVPRLDTVQVAWDLCSAESTCSFVSSYACSDSVREIAIPLTIQSLWPHHKLALMSIKYDEVISELETAVPDFTPDPYWDGLQYLIINDFARYICLVVQESENDLNRALEFVDRCVNEGDSRVRELMHECIETMSECEQASEIKGRVGPRTRALWNKFFDVHRL